MWTVSFLEDFLGFLNGVLQVKSDQAYMVCEHRMSHSTDKSTQNLLGMSVVLENVSD